MAGHILKGDIISHFSYEVKLNSLFMSKCVLNPKTSQRLHDMTLIELSLYEC